MTLSFQHHGEFRDVNANDDELRLYERIHEILADAGHSRNRLELFRRSDNYLTAGVDTGEKYGVVDVVRFKYTPSARWIVLPLIGTEKIRLTSTQDLYDYSDEIVRHYEDALKYVE
jgi:hypothetical protein